MNWVSYNKWKHKCIFLILSQLRMTKSCNKIKKLLNSRKNLKHKVLCFKNKVKLLWIFKPTKINNQSCHILNLFNKFNKQTLNSRNYNKKLMNLRKDLEFKQFSKKKYLKRLGACIKMKNVIRIFIRKILWVLMSFGLMSVMMISLILEGIKGPVLNHSHSILETNCMVIKFLVSLLGKWKKNLVFPLKADKKTSLTKGSSCEEYFLQTFKSI